jgi:glycosylphosphatidylinositol transamidase
LFVCWKERAQNKEEKKNMTSITTTTTTADNDDDNKTKQSSTITTSNKLQRVLSILLIVSYILGITWTCLHPIMSILTGEFHKCRGWFLDEHSIEIRFIDSMNTKVTKYLQKEVIVPSTTSSLCDNVNQHDTNNNNMICYTHQQYFDMVMITPISNALDATEEAVVVVVPSLEDSSFYSFLINGIFYLDDPIETPWLAKTVIFVTPTTTTPSSQNQTVEETTTNFLDAHSGYGERASNTIPLLPSKLSKSIIRNVIVLDIRMNDEETTTPGTTNLAVLAQGRRGVLPNADLVFLVGKLFERTSMMFQGGKFLTHPYIEDSASISTQIDRLMKNNHQLLSAMLSPKTISKLKDRSNDLANMLLFMKTMAIGPAGAHSAALDRGIDSVTIRIEFPATPENTYRMETIQYTLYLIRALSNLHERLHHSLTLYLLPTSRTFVSHMEYFLPNVLVLLPLAIRAFGVLLPTMTAKQRQNDGTAAPSCGFDLSVVGGSLLVLLVSTVVMCLTITFSKILPVMTLTLMGLYTVIGSYWTHRRRRRRQDINTADDNENSTDDEGFRVVRTLQFVSCVLAAYILAPLAFANTSLSYFPSLLWTAVFAFPDYAEMLKKNGTRRSTFQQLMLLVVLVCTAAPVLLVPRIFSSYTPFVRFAYMPLHLHLFLLVLTIRSYSGVHKSTTIES